MLTLLVSMMMYAQGLGIAEQGCSLLVCRWLKGPGSTGCAVLWG